MNAEQKGNLPIDPREPDIPFADSRLQRVSYYLSRRVRSESPHQFLTKRAITQDAITSGFFTSHTHYSTHAYLEGMTQQPVPLAEEGNIYQSSMTNVCEEMHRLVTISSYSHELSLAERIQSACGFTLFQMNKWMNGVSEAQLKQMVRTI